MYTYMYGAGVTSHICHHNPPSAICQALGCHPKFHFPLTNTKPMHSYANRCMNFMCQILQDCINSTFFLLSTNVNPPVNNILIVRAPQKESSQSYSERKNNELKINIVTLDKATDHLFAARVQYRGTYGHDQI